VLYGGWDTGLLIIVKGVGFGGHDEVVAVQTFDFVGPPIDGDAPPFGEQGWMVIFGFGEVADLVGEFERLQKVIKFEDATQAGDAVDGDDVPIGRLRFEQFDLDVAQRRLAAATGDAFEVF
jgi:hypothetical protein